MIKLGVALLLVMVAICQDNPYNLTTHEYFVNPWF
jgi:hypothetical protein